MSFFPLDEEPGLQPGRYTPWLQAAMSRLGSKLPFREAAEALARQGVELLECDGGESTVQPTHMPISAKGALIHLIDGQWREVKTVAVADYETVWGWHTRQSRVRSHNLSYFSRPYPARDFERYALGELHRRGLARVQPSRTASCYVVDKFKLDGQPRGLGGLKTPGKKNLAPRSAHRMQTLG